MNIGIIGLGLIGGSMGKSLTKRSTHTVYGFDQSATVLLKAKLVEACKEELNKENLSKMDVILIAVYPRAVEGILEDILPYLSKNTLVMDLCGIKENIVYSMLKAKERYPDIEFIAAHPMAGREYCGIEHASVNLFDRASALMINVHTTIEKLCLAKELFLNVGFSQVVMTTAERHDEMIAYTSQLAHLVSSSYVKNPLARSHQGYSAGSFRDLTRVSRLNPTMWSELMLDNRENLLSQLDDLQGRLSEYRKALAEGDEGELIRLLSEGNELKEIIEKETREWKKQ